jgi:hypothetical protein
MQELRYLQREAASPGRSPSSDHGVRAAEARWLPTLPTGPRRPGPPGHCGGRRFRFAELIPRLLSMASPIRQEPSVLLKHVPSSGLRPLAPRRRGVRHPARLLRGEVYYPEDRSRSGGLLSRGTRHEVHSPLKICWGTVIMQDSGFLDSRCDSFRLKLNHRTCRSRGAGCRRRRLPSSAGCSRRRWRSHRFC